MAVDKLVDSSKLNAALDYEASKIIAKGGGTAPLAFDLENEKGFGDYVDAIPTGGGGASGYTLLNSGTFTGGPTSGRLVIPVSYTGTPKIVMVFVETPLADTGQGIGYAWFLDNTLNTYMQTYLAGNSVYPAGFWINVIRAANNNYNYQYLGAPKFNGGNIECGKISNNYPWQTNTYKWYIYGEAAS